MEFSLFSFTWLLILLIFSLTGIVICKTFYNNVKNEERKEKGKVIQTILKTYAIVQSIGWPFLMSMTWLFYFNKSQLNELGMGFMQLSILSLRFLVRLLRNYIGCNSFIIALCRYLFIIKDDMVLKVGIGKIRYILLVSSIAVPMVLSLVSEATTPVEYAYFCVFMPQGNQTLLSNASNGILCSEDFTTKSFESPIYIFFWNSLPPSIRYATWTVRLILMFIVHTNIFEGVMYLHIYVFYWR